MTPTQHHGWIVVWYTGHRVNLALPGNDPYIKRLTKSYSSVSRDAVDAKAAEQIRKGYQIAYMGQCILTQDGD